LTKKQNIWPPCYFGRFSVRINKKRKKRKKKKKKEGNIGQLVDQTQLFTTPQERSCRGAFNAIAEDWIRWRCKVTHIAPAQ